MLRHKEEGIYKVKEGPAFSFETIISLILQIHVATSHVSMDLVHLVLAASTLVSASLDSQERIVMRTLMTVLVVNVSTVLVWMVLQTTPVTVTLASMVLSVTRKSTSVTLQTATMGHVLIL